MDDQKEGKFELRDAVVSEFRAFVVARRSNVHANAVAKILRSHLLAEALLRKHVQVMNPNLGSIEDLGLSFDRLRIAAIGLRNGGVKWANDELIAINKIRNKLAHRLDAQITREDVRPLVRGLEDTFEPNLLSERFQAEIEDPARAMEVYVVLFGFLLTAQQLLHQELLNIEAKRKALHDEATQLLRQAYPTQDGVDDGA